MKQKLPTITVGYKYTQNNSIQKVLGMDTKYMDTKQSKLTTALKKNQIVLAELTSSSYVSSRKIQNFKHNCFELNFVFLLGASKILVKKFICADFSFPSIAIKLMKLIN